MRDLDREVNNKRTTTFLVITVVVFSILILRLFYLQIIRGSYYQDSATRNSLRTKVLKASRGNIYDREGKILARNSFGYQLIHTNTISLSKKDYDLLLSLENESDDMINDKYVNEKNKHKKSVYELMLDINEVSTLFEVDKKEIIKTIYRTLPNGVEKEVILLDDIKDDIALKNVEIIGRKNNIIVEYPKRYYPNKEIASHVIGEVKLINKDEYDNLKSSGYELDSLIGKKGIEKEYDSIMKGVNGKEYIEVDIKGNMIKSLNKTVSEAGSNVYLSIDLELQKYMTDVLKNKSGVFIAMEAKTGKIITFVSAPEIDLNLLSSRISIEDWNKLINNKKTPLVNKGISGLYPAGSTFKPISGAAILESGISPRYEIMSTGTYVYGKSKFRDSHTYGHGRTNFYKSIEESVNTYYYQLLQKVDFKEFENIAREFGVGKYTGIDIPGELKGVLPTPEWKKERFKTKSSQIWLPGDLINLSIGQGYLLMTPMQVLMEYSIIANNGYAIQPTFIDKFVDRNGIETTKQINKYKALENVSDKNIKVIQDALTLAVQGKNGTARSLNNLGVKISAKTGTAQNSNFKDHHSWLAGYFPSKEPEIIFVSLIEGGGYGSGEATEVTREFIIKYMEKYNKREEQ